MRLAKQSQFIRLQNVVYFITLPFLVRKILTFYVNDVLLFKCPVPLPTVNPMQCWRGRTKCTFLCGWHCAGHYIPPAQLTCRRSCRISTALEVEFYARYPANSNLTFVPTTHHVSWLILFISVERIVPALLCSLTCRQVSVKTYLFAEPKMGLYSNISKQSKWK